MQKSLEKKYRQQKRDVKFIEAKEGKQTNKKYQDLTKW